MHILRCRCFSSREHQSCYFYLTQDAVSLRSPTLLPVSFCGSPLPWQQQGRHLTIWRVDPHCDEWELSCWFAQTVTCRSTVSVREQQIQTHSDMQTHTHATHLRCPDMSLHSAGGHLLVVPCPKANTLHNWFISSQTPCSLVGSSCSLSLWRCGFKFCIHALNLP